jgi:hypothetical protein
MELEFGNSCNMRLLGEKLYIKKLNSIPGGVIGGFH